MDNVIGQAAKGLDPKLTWFLQGLGTGGYLAAAIMAKRYKLYWIAVAGLSVASCAIVLARELKKS